VLSPEILATVETITTGTVLRNATRHALEMLLRSAVVIGKLPYTQRAHLDDMEKTATRSVVLSVLAYVT